jgi:hypothetical protein
MDNIGPCRQPTVVMDANISRGSIEPPAMQCSGGQLYRSIIDNKVEEHSDNSYSAPFKKFKDGTFLMTDSKSSAAAKKSVQCTQHH